MIDDQCINYSSQVVKCERLDGEWDTVALRIRCSAIYREAEALPSRLREAGKKQVR